MSKYHDIIECQNLTFEDCKNNEKTEHCILFIKKERIGDPTQQLMLPLFQKCLVDYIVDDRMDGYFPNKEGIDKDVLKSHLLSGFKNDANEKYQKFTENLRYALILQYIHFPKIDDRYGRSHYEILNFFNKIEFHHCIFNGRNSYISDIRNTAILYTKCEFNCEWYIDEQRIITGAEALFTECTFHKNITIEERKLELDSEERNNEERKHYKIEITMFQQCKFLGKIEAHNFDFKNLIFYQCGEGNNDQGIEKIEIYNCVFHNKFILNGIKINEFNCLKTTFKSRFDLGHNEFSSFTLSDTNIDGLATLYDSKFQNKFLIEKYLFGTLSDFEECVISQENPKTATIKYTTFMEYINLRGAKFLSGLDIEHANFKEEPKFLNVEISSQNTNRETFRIIKNSFDKVGNHIEANKFYVKEMKKYGEEIKGDKNKKQERVIFFVNRILSNFGQSYIYPILWILFFLLIYSGVIYGYENNFLYRIIPSWNEYILKISICLNRLAQNILPFKKFLKEGMELISLLFYLIFVGLIWHTITAIKRHTKR